jgi:hypothetical protein
MKTFKGIYFLTVLIFLKIVQEIFFRIVSVFMYPLAYIFRKQIRTYLYIWNGALIKEVTFTDTRNVLKQPMNLKTRFVWLFWIFLDDSPAKDNINLDGTPSYDSSTSRKYYLSDFIYNNRVLRDIWWSFIRNNTVNFVSWNVTGGWKKPIEYTCLLGEYNENIDKSDDNVYYVPGMYLIRVKHNDGSINSRFTYVGEILGHKIGIWMGKSSGSGRFSFSTRIK